MPVPEPAAIAAELLDAAARAIPAGLSGGRTLGIGWATVELERAASELGASLGLPANAWELAARDQLLGARALLGPHLGSRLGSAPGPDAGGPRLLVLEPDTEGRLAASLARHGEGVAAVYVAASRAEPPTLAPAARETASAGGSLPQSAAAGASPAGPARSSVATGPLGRGRLVLGGPIWGPHVIVLEAPASAESLPSAGD
jgi:hypothetical protein